MSHIVEGTNPISEGSTLMTKLLPKGSTASPWELGVKCILWGTHKYSDHITLAGATAPYPCPSHQLLGLPCSVASSPLILREQAGRWVWRLLLQGQLPSTGWDVTSLTTPCPSVVTVKSSGGPALMLWVQGSLRIRRTFQGWFWEDGGTASS